MFLTSSLTENAICRRHTGLPHIARNPLAVPQARRGLKGTELFPVRATMPWNNLPEQLRLKTNIFIWSCFWKLMWTMSLSRKHSFSTLSGSIIVTSWWAVFHNFLTSLSKTMKRLIDHENKTISKTIHIILKWLEWKWPCYLCCLTELFETLCLFGWNLTF